MVAAAAGQDRPQDAAAPVGADTGDQVDLVDLVDLAASRVYVAGHTGMVGSAVWRALQAAGVGDLVGATSAELDLRDRSATAAFLDRVRPDVVVLAAARVGGIAANAARPVDFLSDNLLIQTNVLDGAHAADVHRLLFLGSSCIYPKMAPQPIVESALLTGPLEPTNEAYAIAKIAGVKLVQAYRAQYGRSWVSAMPTNLYGPGDTFDAEASHVLPALLMRLDDAARQGTPEVTVWGSGTPRREFLHVDDLASACLLLLRRYDGDAPVNVGYGDDLTIAELVDVVAHATGYRGQLRWDTTRPDGTPRKLLDSSVLAALGFSPSVDLRTGVAATLAWYRAARLDR